MCLVCVCDRVCIVNIVGDDDEQRQSIYTLCSTHAHQKPTSRSPCVKEGILQLSSWKPIVASLIGCCGIHRSLMVSGASVHRWYARIHRNNKPPPLQFF